MLRFLIYALALLNVATALNVGPLTTPNHVAVVSRSSQIVCAEAKYVLSHGSPFFIWRVHFADRGVSISLLLLLRRPKKYKKKPYLERLKGPSARQQGRMVAQQKREAAAAAEKEKLAKEAAAAAAAEAESEEAEEPPAEE